MHAIEWKNQDILVVGSLSFLDKKLYKGSTVFQCGVFDTSGDTCM